jgi:UDP-N-acetylmuramate dehydrogenase
MMAMEVHTNIPLKNYTTMKLGGNARFMSEVHEQSEIAAVYKNATAHSLSVFVLGGGSNVIAKDEGYSGLIIRIRIPGFEVIADDLNSTTVKVGAGEDWDTIVKRVIAMRLSGIEAMSGIPGTAGGTPIQNVGAYGQEIADTLESVDAYDTKTDSFVVLTAEQCGFSYRHSIFRGDEQGRYIISHITLRLSKSPPQAPFYDSLQKYFDEHDIHLFTLDTVRSAVLAIRADKLPDPKVRPNAGSFFKNTIIETWQLPDLQAIDHNIPTYDMGDGHLKVPTGWLIEHVNLKGALLHGIRVNEKNCLVLINESAQTYKDLSDARDEIIAKVRDTFRIQIFQEPLEI